MGDGFAALESPPERKKSITDLGFREHGAQIAASGMPQVVADAAPGDQILSTLATALGRARSMVATPSCREWRATAASRPGRNSGIWA
jgi:hypothetical protein